MRYLFALRHADYLRRFESTVRLLCRRGHQVTAAFGLPEQAGPDSCALATRMEAEMEGFLIRTGPEPRGRDNWDLDKKLRSMLDYLRFLEPELERADKYRDRVARDVDPEIREGFDATAGRPEFRRVLTALIRTAGNATSPCGEVLSFVREEKPDAILVSPLLERRTPQAEYLRSAHALGVPCGLCVASWDNLTSTTLIHGAPDLIAVWNEAQREEAVRLHGANADDVVVTGAPLHDAWFEQRPSSSRAAFCERVGFDGTEPYILYAGSSSFTAPREAGWVLRWIKRIREASSPSGTARVLVRPHPTNPILDESKAAEELQALDGVAVYPPNGSEVVTEEAMAEYYDSIHHSAAVVGINTSAMLESAIVGRGVHVLVGKRHRDTQENAVHFDHLRTAGGGLVIATESVKEHIAGLDRALRGEDADEVAERSRRFLSAFIRPFGLDEPATPRLAAALEELGGRPKPIAEATARRRLEQRLAELEGSVGLERADGGSADPP